MPTFFAEQPLLLQVLPTLDRGLLVGLNRVGQVLIVTAAMMAIYQEHLLGWIPRSLSAVSRFIRNLAAGAGWRWTHGDIGFEFPPERPLTDKHFHEDIEIRKQLVLSAVLLVIAIWLFGRGPLGWISFPFELAWQGITLWANVQWNIWSFAHSAGASSARLLAFFPMLYFSILACAIVARPFAFFFSHAAERIAAGHYRVAMVAVLLLGSLLVLVAT